MLGLFSLLPRRRCGLLNVKLGCCGGSQGGMNDLRTFCTHCWTCRVQGRLWFVVGSEMNIFDLE
jgi:hypothetical protein